MPEAKDTYKETCVDEKLHRTKMKMVIFQGWMMMVPLYDEEKEKKEKGGNKIKLKMKLKKRENGKTSY
jgi:hypothetical protein